MTGQGFGRWEKKDRISRDDKESSTFVMDDVWINAPDQKFIVFKRSELLPQVPSLAHLEAMAVYDAVVIRTQDEFAGPALHTYAATIAVAAKLLKEKDAETSRRLQNIADYFHFRSLEADDGTHKLPD